MGLRRLLLPGLLALLVAAPAVAQAGSDSDFYPYRGYCGLAAVSIRLFGYGETVELGASLSGAPAGTVSSFIAWCGTRGVGGDDTSGGAGARECTFSSDCPKSCSGTDIVQDSCIDYKCVPPPSVEERCEYQSTTVAGYTFPNTCTGSAPAAACGKDAAAIRAKRNELEKQYNDLNGNKRPALNDLFLRANKICLNGLADVTDKLIVDTANALKSPPTKLIDVVSDLTGQLIDAVSGMTGATSNPTDTQKEFFLKMCNLESSIKNTDMPLLDRKIQKLLDDIKALDAAS